MIPPLKRLLRADPPARLLSLDPGGTTGYAVWVAGKLDEIGQVVVDIQDLDDFLTDKQPTAVTAEDYRVYASHLDQHAQSSLPTVRLLGAIELWCCQRQVSFGVRMAGQVKAFVTDEKLRAWRLYAPKQVHAMDAVRHGVYYLVFGAPEDRTNAEPKKRKHTVG